jgi:TPP-dependent indolepyruvate ferredoxin oxidoreductase alpha subunit
MEEYQLMKGNEAVAEAAIRAGTDGYFGYPITPQSEVMEYPMKEQEWLSFRQRAKLLLLICFMAAQHVGRK